MNSEKKLECKRYRSAPAHDNILLIRITCHGWTRIRRWKESFPPTFVMYLFTQIRAASRASLEIWRPLPPYVVKNPTYWSEMEREIRIGENNMIYLFTFERNEMNTSWKIINTGFFSSKIVDTDPWVRNTTTITRLYVRFSLTISVAIWCIGRNEWKEGWMLESSRKPEIREGCFFTIEQVLQNTRPE
jgi:hypothetical protein